VIKLTAPFSITQLVPIREGPTLIRTTISQILRTKIRIISASTQSAILSSLSIECQERRYSRDPEDPDLCDRVTPPLLETVATLRHPGVSKRASNMDALRSRNMPTSASIVGLLLLVGKTSAHGGHMEKIQEGEYMSAEPIVCSSMVAGCCGC
jgi:hypothetical protein